MTTETEFTATASEAPIAQYVAPASATGRPQGRRLLFPPGITDLSITSDLAALRGEMERLYVDLAAIQTDLGGIDRGKAEARKQDLADLAKAIRTGIRDPGDSRMLDLEARQNAQKRRQAGLQLAAEAVTRDILALLDLRRADWEAEVAAALVVDRQAAREAFGQFRGIVERIADREAAARWLANPGRSLSRSINIRTDLRTSSTGETYHMTKVLDSIESAIAEPITVLPGIWRDASAPQIERDEAGAMRRSRPGSAADLLDLSD